jgi:hypothetical protein
VERLKLLALYSQGQLPYYIGGNVEPKTGMVVWEKSKIFSAFPESKESLVIQPVD